MSPSIIREAPGRADGMDGPIRLDDAAQGCVVPARSRRRRRFHVCTFVSDAHLYRGMVGSFVAAGFDQEVDTFAAFDNVSGNEHDPYRTITRILGDLDEPYVVFCHQDVRLDRGHGRERLLAVIEELDRVDPDWAVAGNAGVTRTLESACHITEPGRGEMDSGGLPCRVQALDENFLLVKRRPRLGCTPGLSGFHLYAADLCLNAERLGYTCYAIDFHLTHLSAGTRSREFWRCVRAFERAWRGRHRARLVASPAACVFLSRHMLLRWVCGRPRVTQAIVAHRRRYALVRWALGLLEARA